MTEELSFGKIEFALNFSDTADHKRAETELSSDTRHSSSSGCHWQTSKCHIEWENNKLLLQFWNPGNQKRSAIFHFAEFEFAERF